MIGCGGRQGCGASAVEPASASEQQELRCRIVALVSSRSRWEHWKYKCMSAESCMHETTYSLGILSQSRSGICVVHERNIRFFRSKIPIGKCSCCHKLFERRCFGN